MPGDLKSAARGRALAVLSLVAVAAVWGITFPIVRTSVSGYPPILFLAVRFLCASIVLVPIVWRRSGLRALGDRSILLPGICLALGYWLQTEGLRTVGSSVSAFLTGTSVVLVPIIGRAIGWERPGIRGWGGVLIAIGGIYLLEGRFPDRWSVGETMTACCAVAFAVQILLVGRVAARRSRPLELGAGQILVATLIFSGIAGVRHAPALLHGIPPGVAYAAIMTGLLATAVAFVVQMKAQEVVPPRQAAVCFATEPLFAALFSTAFYGESMTGRGWIGAGAIVLAILLVSTEMRSAPRGPLVERGSQVC
jgi:drug/metabolite transporter (DMT)-like permease